MERQEYKLNWNSKNGVIYEDEHTQLIQWDWMEHYRIIPKHKLFETRKGYRRRYSRVLQHPENCETFLSKKLAEKALKKMAEDFKDEFELEVFAS